jgi:hypothetical protein
MIWGRPCACPNQMRYDLISIASKIPLVGEVAGALLASGQTGKVLAAVDHADYLLTDTGDLFWLVGRESPMHPRCIQWPAPLPRLTVDSPFSIQGRSIQIEAGMKLDLSSSQVWKSSLLPVGKVIDIELLPSILIACIDNYLSIETPIGFGSFILPIFQQLKGQVSLSDFQPGTLVTMAAWSAVERIAQACMSHDLPGVLDQAETLVGLGEGLTPSGDDFLGGLFFARYLLAYAYPHLSYLVSFDLFDWVGAVQPRTNLISFVLLRDNAVGHALDPLNRFGLAFLTNGSMEDANSAVSDLIKVGHSSGWSLLAGFLVGMLLAFKSDLART